jgi:hypothetical protein
VQPPHLRHLAVVRRFVTKAGITNYTHHSWDAIQKMLDTPAFDASQVLGAKEALESLVQGSDDRVDADGTAQRLPTTDDFGFSSQGAPPLQVRGGNITLRDLIRATGADDVESQAGDIVIARKGAELVLTKHEEPAAVVRFRPPRLQPTSSTPRTPKRKRARPNDEDVIRGRPRKYIRGTEKFWRMQFKQVRLAAGADEDHTRERNMKDPLSIVFHASQPEGFDEVLVEALDAKLPVPIGPEDIDKDWMRSTRKILDRLSPGVYLSPKGLRGDNFGKLSRVMIIKTPRLAALDLTDRSTAPAFRFISSSVAHSFAYRRFYPNLPVIAPQVRRTPINLKRKTWVSSEKQEERKSGPRLGIFYEKAFEPLGELGARLPSPWMRLLQASESKSARKDYLDAATKTYRGRRQWKRLESSRRRP